MEAANVIIDITDRIVQVCFYLSSFNLTWTLKCIYFFLVLLAYCYDYTTCSDKGDCRSDGTCKCDYGYYGADCSSIPSLIFIW